MGMHVGSKYIMIYRYVCHADRILSSLTATGMHGADGHRIFA